MRPAEQAYDPGRHSLVSKNAHEGARPAENSETLEVLGPAKVDGWRTKVVSQEWAPALLYLCLDLGAWIGIYGTTSALRGAFFVSNLQFIIVNGLALGAIVGFLFIIGGYDRHVEMRGLSYSTEHILAIISAAVVSSALIYSAATFDQSMKPSRGVLLVSFLLFLPVSILYRRLIHTHVAASTANQAFLVVGTGQLATEFYEAYKKSVNRQRLDFVDLGEDRIGRHLAGEDSPVIQGDLAGKLASLGQEYTGIILAEGVKQLSGPLLERLVRTQFQRTRVYTLESFYEAHWRYVPVQSIDPVWPLQTGFQLARISPYHYLKRLFDLAFAATALTICGPLFALIYLVVRKPVIFRQERIGRESISFTIYKFRTMKLRPGEEDEDIYTREDDARITKVGRWLRRWRLDELPQLWNVLKGEMSLIGPRAEWSKCAERYEKKIPFYHFRHLVKPGITGWAQVNYPYGESEEDAIEKLKYDLYYIRHYSLKLDAMIVLKTVHVMLFGKGR